MITADILDLAYQWLCQQRSDAHHNHDIWHLRWHWNGVRTKLLDQLAAGTYRLSPTRWKLRKVVRINNRVLHRLRVDKHLAKTFVSRVVSGFEFLGDHLKPSLKTGKADAQATAEDATKQPTNISRQVDAEQLCALTVHLRVAKKTRQRFVSRVTRLYEQGSIHPSMIEGSVRRWKQWAAGGRGEYAY